MGKYETSDKFNININRNYFDFEKQSETHHFYIIQKAVLH